MTKSLRVLTQNLFGVPVGPPFRTEFQLYHVHRLSRFRKFIAWVEQMQNPPSQSTKYGSIVEDETKRRTSSSSSPSSSTTNSFVGSGPFDIIALQEVFKWRTGFFSRFVLLPLWRCLSCSELSSSCSTMWILLHWIVMIISWADGMFWGWMGFVWDDQQFIINLASKRLGMRFSATPKLPPIRYLWHALIWLLAATLAAPIVLSRIYLGKSEALIAAGGVLLLVLFILGIAAYCFGRRIVGYISSRTSVSPFIIDSGLVLLSREPIIDRGRFVFKYIPGSGLEGFFCQKGAIWFDIKIGDETLRVINTHLQSDADGTCRLKPYTVRELQFQQLRADIFKKQRRVQNGVATLTKDECPLLLMGDLNILRHGSDAEYTTAKSIMGLKGLESSRLITHRVTQNHFDHIWMTADKVLSARVQAHHGHGHFGFISDHNGVEAMIICK